MARRSTSLPYVVLTGVIIVSVVAVFVYILPTWSEYQENESELESEIQKLVQLDSQIKTLDQKISQINSQAVVENQLSVMLPDNEQIEDFLRVADRAAVTSGVVLESFSNEGLQAQSSFRAQAARTGQSVLPQSVLPLAGNIQISGTYQQIRGFITAIENSPRLSTIPSFEIARSANLTPDGLSQALLGKLEIRFYQYEK